MEALENPIHLIAKPGSSTPRERRLNANEEKRLLAACEESKSESLESIVKLARETGCRLSELLSMQWKHVDLRACTVTLPVTNSISKSKRTGNSAACPSLAKRLNFSNVCQKRMKFASYISGKMFGALSLAHRHCSSRSRPTRPQRDRIRWLPS
jgi:site-specific recombinase XerC